MEGVGVRVARMRESGGSRGGSEYWRGKRTRGEKAREEKIRGEKARERGQEERRLEERGQEERKQEERRLEDRPVGMGTDPVQKEAGCKFPSLAHTPRCPPPNALGAGWLCGQHLVDGIQRIHHGWWIGCKWRK
jgi:hypothetical protein